MRPQNSKRVNSSRKLLLTIAIRLIEEAVRHTNSPDESIPFLLRRMDCEMSLENPGGAFNTGLRQYILFRSDSSAAHSLGSGFDLPLGDANAESFADSLYPHIKAREEDILAIADLPPLENKTILFLQEILCKLSIFI